MSAHMPGPSIATDFEGLKRMAREFHDALPTLNRDELENAFKAFGLALLGCDFPDNAMGEANRLAGAPALFRIVSREYTHRQIELDSESCAVIAKATAPTKAEGASK